METTPQMSELYYQLLHEIQQIDFVCLELNLYLNTHPDDSNAINQFNLYSMKSKELKTEFEALFGPLTNFGNSYSKYPWSWAESPWPWQV